MFWKKSVNKNLNYLVKYENFYMKNQKFPMALSVSKFAIYHTFANPLQTINENGTEVFFF